MANYHSNPTLVNYPRHSRIQRTGSPDFAGDQRSRLIQLLKQAGPAGISRERFLDPHDLAMSQVGARRDELEKQGFKIGSFRVEGERFVRYRLDFEPHQSIPLPARAPRPNQNLQPEPARSWSVPADTQRFLDFEMGRR